MRWLVGGAFGADGELLFAAPDLAVVVASAGALLAFGLAAWSSRGARAAWLQLSLLALALGCLVLALAEPIWVEEEGHLSTPRTVVLVDDSRSMQVREDGRSRSEQVEAVLQAVGPAEVYTFGAELAAGAPSYEQGASDLGAALSAVTDRYVGERLASLVVNTDGLDRGGLRQAWREGLAAELPELPGPLTVYQVGDRSDIEDLAITEVQTGGFAFQRSPMDITVGVSGTGYAGQTVPLTLSRDGRPVETRDVVLGEDGVASATFTVTPTKPGRFSFSASVPVYGGDAVPANNAMPVAVRVLRDKMRVLQVCGSPSFDQKFLRLFLKQDPSVDLVSFFILRTRDDMDAGWRDEELSLIAFPYEDLFDTELWNFDLVIFQNFDYAPFFQRNGRRLLQNIVDYVQEGDGGAFVMIGGDRSFDLGGYGDTPLADILPVQLGVSGDTVDTEAFQPLLTGAGRLHPITRLSPEPAENEAWWGRLSPLDGLNLSLGPAPGSAVLLGHPDRTTAAGEPMPVMAVREVGAGRSLAIMSDSSWRWVMSEAARGQGNQAFLRFWKNAMRWLTRDPESQRVQVEAAQDNLVVGEDARLVVSVKDVGFGPLEGAEVAVYLGEDKERFDAVTDGFGEAVVDVGDRPPGAWRVEVVATFEGQQVGQAETVFAVTDRDPELDEVVADEAFLRELAERSGGAWQSASSPAAPLRDNDAGRRVMDRVETPLWAAPGWVLLAALFASLSWWLRRRAGLR